MYALPFIPHSALRIPQMWGMEGFVRQRPSGAVTVHRPPSTVYRPFRPGTVVVSRAAITISRRRPIIANLITPG